MWTVEGKWRGGVEDGGSGGNGRYGVGRRPRFGRLRCLGLCCLGRLMLV